METRIGRLHVFHANPAERRIGMALDWPVQAGRIAPVQVPPDDQLLEPFAALARHSTLDIELDIDNGVARRARLASRYFATRVAEAESATVEFKQSIFLAPGETEPSGRQFETIAQTIASFMNGGGGTLFLGVHDSGQVRTGIRNDLALLGAGGPGTVVSTPKFSDAEHTYHGNADSYGRKIHALVRAYLGGAAEAYLGDCTEHAANGGQKYVQLEIKPAPDSVVVYYPQETNFGLVDAIYVRNGAAKKSLIGSDRDAFVRERTRRQVLANVQAVNAQNADGLVTRIVEAINNGFAPAVIGGAPVQVEGAVALDDPNLGALSSPKGLVFDGAHVCDVKGWKGAYEALLKKLNELDAAKFDALPEADYFRKFFVAVQPRRKYPGYFKTVLGSAANVRAKEVPNKTYFINPAYVVQRLLAHFGVEPGRVALRG